MVPVDMSTTMALAHGDQHLNLTLARGVQGAHVEDVDALHLAENLETLETGGLLEVGRDGSGGGTGATKVVLRLDLCAIDLVLAFNVPFRRRSTRPPVHGRPMAGQCFSFLHGSFDIQDPIEMGGLTGEGLVGLDGLGVGRGRGLGSFDYDTD